ncbi:hypothetical protein FHG87_002227 [Trinorchestia longiramus]|nr:hypothetical protein FHG87_002227 [Trinorchestia longiramus]
MHVRVVLAAVFYGLWPIALADFGEKIIADVKPSDKPEFHLQLTKFDSYNPNSKTRQYSTRYRSRDSNTLNAPSQQSYEGDPISSVVAPPINFKSETNTESIETSPNSDHQISEENIDHHDDEKNQQLLTIERSDTDLNEQPQKTGQRRINSKVFRKRLRERLRQRLQNNTENSTANSQDVSTTSKPASAFRSRGRFRGASTTSSNEKSSPKPNSEKKSTPSVSNQRLQSGTGKRGNSTFYTKYRGRAPSTFTNSRGLRLRSRVTTTTTEKITTLPQVDYSSTPSDESSLPSHSDITQKEVSMKPSPIDSSTMQQTGIVDEFVPGSGSTNFEDIFSDFRSKQHDVRATKRPNSPSQRYQVVAPELLPTTVAIRTKTTNPNVQTFTVTKQPSVLQSSFNIATFSPEKNVVSPTSQIRSTVYQFGPSFSALEHEKNKNQPSNKEDKGFIIKLEPQEFDLNDEHLSGSKKHCDSHVNNSQCRSSSGALNTSILESTRDIIRQAETAGILRERSRPLRASTTTRPSSWHNAPAPNVKPPTSSSGWAPGQPPGEKSASSEGNLYRDDIMSGSGSASWHQRRPQQELEARTEGLNNGRTKPIQSVDFGEANTPRPAVFSTFEHFLRMGGVTESPFTVVQAPNNHSIPLAVSFQNSYLGRYDEYSKATSKIPANVLSRHDHPNSLKSSKNAIAHADLTLNTLKGNDQIREQNLFFRTPSSLSETTALRITTTATPAYVQRARNTRVADHSLHQTTKKYDVSLFYPQHSTHKEERSTAAPNSLKFVNAAGFDEQPILPRRKVSPSAETRAKFSNKLRHHEVSREALHHQVLQSPEEPAFITHQKKTQLFPFPTPSVIHRPHISDVNNHIPTSTHFKAVLLEDGKNDIVEQSRAPQFTQSLRAPNRDNLQNQRQEEFSNSVLDTRPVNIRPGRPRLFRNLRPSLGRLHRGPNPQENFLKVSRLRNQANSRVNSLMKPPPQRQRRTQHRTSLRPKPINKSRNRPQRLQESFLEQESRNNVIITPPQAPFMRVSQLNAGGYRLNGPLQKRRKITPRPPPIPSLSSNKIQLESIRPLRASRRPQIVLNSRPPITSLPAHLQVSPAFPEPLRNARHNAFQNHVIPSNFHKSDPVQGIPKNQPRTRTINHRPQHNTAQFPPTVKPTFEENEAQFRESHTDTKYFEPPRNYKQSHAQRRPTPSGSHVYPVRELEPIHQNEISLSAISQPLPHHALLKTTRNKMAESHVSLLKNLEFGVNGEPLDVWIPMKSDRTLKLVGRGETLSAARTPIRPRNYIPIAIDRHSNDSTAEKVDPLHASESMTVPEYAIKDVMDGDKDFNYKDYDEYKDRLDEPQAASSMEEVVTHAAEEEDDDYPDYQDSPFGQRENNAEDDHEQQEQEDDEEDVFEEDDDDL